MSLQTKAIKEKIKSVSNIGKIAKTMEMISVAKMRKAVVLARSSKEYSEAIFGLLSHLSGQTYLKNSHFLFKKRKTGKRLIVVIASDKGLCGSYNLNIHKTLVSFKKKYGEGVDCLTVGKYAEKSARRLNFPVIAGFAKISERSAVDETRVLSKILIDNFKEKSYRSVFVLYTEFSAAAKFRPIIREILPLNEKILKDVLAEKAEIRSSEQTEQKAKENLALYLFEPSEASILEIVLPRLLNSVVYQAFLEAAASEHSSRMFAMKAASDNAAAMRDDLNLSWNRARQDAVTRELAEIVGGSGALAS